MEDLVSNFLSEKNIDSEITFEKYIMSKTKLNNEKQYSVKDICCFNANNDNFKQHYDENKILEIHLNNMVFEQNLSFHNVKKLSLIIDDNVKFQRLCIFGCNELSLRINGRVKIIDKISINNCKFKQISINNHIDGNIEFQKCEFNDFNLYGFSNATIKGAFTFDFCELKEKVNFMNFEFENKVSFKMSKFKDNVYFNNSHFKDYAYFHECEFEKTACFYGVRFDKAPNFSQAIFKGNLNAVNANLNFTFDDLQERIKQEYEDFNKNIENKKSLDKFANDFRDSFRTFKNALIKDNNLLDASNFHKYELYCKEIELKQNWDKRGENVKNTTDLEKNVSRIRDFMDFLLLGFYRKLCDHHTDFLKVFNNLILLIALYALFVFGFTWLHDDKLEDTRAILTLFGFFDKFRLYFDIISTIFVVFGCGFFVCKLDSYEKKNNVSKKQNINFIYIIGDFLNLIKSLFFASFIPCVFYVLFLLFGFFLNLGKDFGYSLLINTLFVSLYICLVYTKSLFFGRYVVLIFSYIGFIIILIKQPNVIHPLIGKIANESDKFFNYPSLIVLNILYTILLVLVLFSLQKTARKNSIVPS
ncbi:pentapeptide repeat-containing protein [Campylobacter jejuni]